jgi:hypothetical protein
MRYRENLSWHHLIKHCTQLGTRLPTRSPPMGFSIKFINAGFRLSSLINTVYHARPAPPKCDMVPDLQQSVSTPCAFPHDVGFCQDQANIKVKEIHTYLQATPLRAG